MSAVKLTPAPLHVRSWFDHATTTIGYIDSNDRFVAVADCSVGAEFAASREPLARVLAAGPVMLALLMRYRNETPLGHQPHMISHEVDALIQRLTGDAA